MITNDGAGARRWAQALLLLRALKRCGDAWQSELKPLLLWAKYLSAGLQRYAYDTKREGSFKRHECLRMRYPSRVLASLAGNYVFLSALNCSFVRRAAWIARGHEGQTVVQFGKFKGRTFEEARALYFRTQLSMTWCI
jgi:hypothetical protein